MNSLLGGIGNSILNGAGVQGSVASGISGTSILLQAVGAAMRGESPQAFMKRLANQHPQLKKMDLDNLQNTAQQLCQQNGVDPGDLAGKIDQVIGPAINK